MRRSGRGLTVLCAFIVAACSERAEPLPPAVFDAAAFRDVPVPAGYRLDPTIDQLAISLADGAIRRYCATYMLPSNRKGPSSDELPDWYRDRLLIVGWSLVDEDHDQARQRWTRKNSAGVDEELVVAVGRINSRPCVRLVLDGQAE